MAGPHLARGREHRRSDFVVGAEQDLELAGPGRLAVEDARAEVVDLGVAAVHRKSLPFTVAAGEYRAACGDAASGESTEACERLASSAGRSAGRRTGAAQRKSSTSSSGRREAGVTAPASRPSGTRATSLASGSTARSLSIAGAA